MSTASGGTRGCIEVRAFFHLARMVGGAGSRPVSLDEVGARAGAPGAAPTVGMVAELLGIGCEPLGMAMVNGRKAELETALHDGDRVAFFPDYIPYHRVYGACVV